MISVQARANRPTILQNVTCLYCRQPLTSENRTKEHVIGRRFVPLGSGENQWNLIANACTLCNALKADLEDDISAITQMMLEHDTSAAEAKAKRKARKSLSRITGRPVEDSEHRSNLKMEFDGGSLTFGLVAPPQIDRGRIEELSEYFFRAIFYLISYDTDAESGTVLSEGFCMVDAAPRQDWGNEKQLEFAKRVSDWPYLFCGLTANSHFKLLLRQAHDRPVMSWAMEWNKVYRIIGFAGRHDLVRYEVGKSPDFTFHQTGSKLRIRPERPLDPQDDVLFMWKDR